MQELIDELKSYSTAVSKENNLDMVAAFNFAIDLARLSIKKEKEQIIDAYYEKIDGVFGYREEGEEYYDQTYNQKEDKTFKQKSKWTSVDNQKQHIIDIMKADEEDGLYNQNK